MQGLDGMGLSKQTNEADWLRSIFSSGTDFVAPSQISPCFLKRFKVNW